ncbi:unnamed protein product [Adineta steineri]|uniref:Solute-binding protein family 3/N-terminal domain-containing protein n=1 Tax=Adineta steineri TaxID=433720 RepID=A0A814TFY1_9BILA|nr:unnamed protein product [Adineta steineri]
MIESTPFTIVTNTTDASGNITTQLTGYFPDLLELLREQMGFIPDIQLASANQTYNGVYDIVIADLAETSTRRTKVDFSNTIFDCSLRIMIRKQSNANVDLFSYSRPFSHNLWLIVLESSIYAVILIYFLERCCNGSLQNRSRFSAIEMSFWF